MSTLDRTNNLVSQLKTTFKQYADAHSFKTMEPKALSGYGSILGYASILKLLPYGKSYGGVSGNLTHGNAFQVFALELSNRDGWSFQKEQLLLIEVNVAYYTPQIIVNATGTTLLPVEYSKEHALQLEGDIPDFFNVYVAEGMETNSLVTLAPDVIASMLATGQLCDIDIYCGQMSFYWNISAATNLEETMRKTDELVSIIEPNLRAIDTRAQDTTAPEIKVRLKKIWQPFDLIYAAFGTIFFLFAARDDKFNALILSAFAAMLLVIFYTAKSTLYKLRKNQEKTKLQDAIKKYHS